MKLMYCILGLSGAFLCGYHISRGNWIWAIINMFCTFLNAKWYVYECNIIEDDDEREMY